MQNLKNILKDITMLTSNIETNYPELYKFLNENKMTIGPVEKSISMGNLMNTLNR